MKEAGFFLAAIAGGSLALGAAPAGAQTPAARPAPLVPPPPLLDEPVVTDEEFEEALPDDPELGVPLEPIDEFDLGPIALPPPGVELVPEEALADPALAEPLPPLAVFDVTPPEEPTEAEERPVDIRYTLVVEGLDEVDLEGRFRRLSALRDARGRAANTSMIIARARQDEALALRILHSEGYYDAEVTSAVEPVPDEPGQVRAIISAAPGQRYHFGEIAIDGPPTEPTELAREALHLESGDPIVAGEVEAAEANVLLRLPQQGYPFPEIGLRDIELIPETGLGDYTLPLNPGPRARFSGFTTEGNLAFDADHVGLLARFEPGQLYDRRLVDDLREAMVSTRLFQSVAAEPVLTGETAPDGAEYVNILVRQEAGPARSLDAQVGFSTRDGLRAEVGWEHRNLFPPEGALRIAAIGGTQEQSLVARFRRSNWGQRDRFLMVRAEAGRRDHAAFEGYRIHLEGLVARESTPIWQKRWTYAYGGELLATNESRFGRARVAFRDAYFIAGLVGQIGYDTSNSLLDPTEGFRLTARVNPELQHQLGDTFQYVRNLVDGSAYYPVGDDFVVAGRVRVGSIYGIPRDSLAPSRRLYSGGGGSVRGFGFQELGPREIVPNPRFDPDNPDDHPETLSLPLGGRSLNEFALEGRYRFGNFGVVAFVDAGQVYESEYPTFQNLRFGVGIGGRLYTNFGPLRIDVATPLARREGESWIAVYMSIGQAF